MKACATFVVVTACIASLASIDVKAMGATKDPAIDVPREPSIRASYNDCMDKANTTADMLACARDEYAYQDRRLNDVYKRLMNSLSDERKSALRTEERKWLTHKTSQCKAPSNGGTLSLVTSSDCAVQETARRAAILEKRMPKTP